MKVENESVKKNVHCVQSVLHDDNECGLSRADVSCAKSVEDGGWYS